MPHLETHSVGAGPPNGIEPSNELKRVNGARPVDKTNVTNHDPANDTAGRAPVDSSTEPNYVRFDSNLHTGNGSYGADSHENNGDTSHSGRANGSDQSKTAYENPPRQPDTGISVIIVGGGPGGLMAAMECWRKGHRVLRILEKSSGPIYTGDIIVVQPSATCVMQHWPELVKGIRQVGLHVSMNYYKQRGEHVFGPCPPTFNDPGAEDERNGPETAPAMARIEFYQMLLENTKKIGLEVEFNRRVKSYFEDEEIGKGGVVLDDGEIAMADIVIAADGGSTKSMQIVNHGPISVRPSGMVIYRAMLPKETAFQDPKVRETWENREHAWEFWLGDGQYCAVVNLPDSMGFAFTPMVDTDADEDWIPDASGEDIINAMGDAKSAWHPAIPALLATAPKGTVIHSPLQWRDLQERWTSRGGRIVQLGDAAHNFLPTSANGATQAIEDAVTLATCLQLSGRANAHIGTKIYNMLRYQRVSCAQKIAFVNGQLKQDTLWEKVDKNPEEIRTRFPKWIWSHDPESYAYQKFGEAFANLQSGRPFKNTNVPSGHKWRPWSITEVHQQMKDGLRVEDLLDGDWS